MAWYHLIIKSVIVTSLIVVVSLFLVVINYSEKPYFLLQPVFGQCFSRNWMFSHPPHKAFKPHRGYLMCFVAVCACIRSGNLQSSKSPTKGIFFNLKLNADPDRIQSGSYLSTGWFTLILAMDMCKEIRVYGMINDTYCKSEGYRKVPYHYYEAGSRDECAEYLLHESAPYGGHRFITEKAVFAKWAKTHPIKFFSPEWQLL
uniref:Alpha-N-acetylgalactosaminide alpha-2,6-sialyltransferase 3 n=1 Tax=Sinocyclocheilus rhinocerous TaxID=307959 RepID=A0A673GRQ7_9TELE